MEEESKNLPDPERETGNAPEHKQEVPKGKSKKNAIILGIAVGAIIILLVVIIVLLLKRDKPAAEPTDNRATVVTKENRDEVLAELGNVPDGMYKVSMTTNWTFEDGSAPSTGAYVKNSTDNTRTVYFDVALADTNEVVYSSPYIPLGGELTEVTLDKDLDKGDYPAVMTYYLVDDDHKVITNVAVSITLHVNN